MIEAEKAEGSEWIREQEYQVRIEVRKITYKRFSPDEREFLEADKVNIGEPIIYETKDYEKLSAFLKAFNR